VKRLPLTVIGGYLGAGKTTLINRLLSEPHGQRVLVMVNDFGAINIDAALLSSQSEDTLELSNGCVCCTMGADLFMAVGDVLDRDPRPDHMVIEASGIADPARIAQVALAEPDLSYGGVVSVVDALNYDALSRDVQIGAQVRGQVDVADLVLVSKAENGVLPRALGLPKAPVLDLAQVSDVAPLILGAPLGQGPKLLAETHPEYVAWSGTSAPMDRVTLQTKLDTRPKGLMRFKGFVQGPDGTGFEVHCVGPSSSIKAAKNIQKTEVVGIGPKGRIDVQTIKAWWSQR
jgi:hypothetical protein